MMSEEYQMAKKIEIHLIDGMDGWGLLCISEDKLSSAVLKVKEYGLSIYE